METSETTNQKRKNYHFLHTCDRKILLFWALHYNDQKKPIENGLLSNQLAEFEDLIKIILNKF